MDLPVRNSQTAILRILLLTPIFVITPFLWHLNTLTEIVLILIWTIWGARYILLRNIRQATLKNDQVEILINRRKIIIEMNEIKSIETAIAWGFDLTSLFSTTYFIRLRNRQSFGDTLELSFNHKNLPFPDPIEIRTIKSLMKFDNRRNKNRNGAVANNGQNA